MKVVCDTNVLISAFKFGGVPYEIIRASIRKQLELFISPAILLEMATVLNKKFNWNNSEILEVTNLLLKISILVKPKNKVNLISDSSDNRILECAEEADADYIITGDKKHLLPLKKYKKTKIISPSQYLHQIIKRKDG